MTRKIVFAGLMGAVAGIAMTAQFSPVSHAQSNTAETYQYLDLFGDVLERARSVYVEPVEDKALIEAALNGMLSSLDPHSSYMSPEDFLEMQIDTSGEFGGLGIEVTMQDGFVKVVSPFDDTPADRAGLEAGDFITHIDGESVFGMTLTEAVGRMRGPVGAEITISIAREGEEEPFDVTIIRDIITVDAVKSRVEGDIGYIRLSTFSEQTFVGLAEAITEIKETLGEDPRGYVIDLRNNPGGLLSQAVKVSDAFLQEGEIVSTRGRDIQDADRYYAETGDLTDGAPIIVLVDGGSASASEIVAGALQDHRRAIIVGEKTFGKGSVQTIMPVSNRGAIRLTTARYYTPSGRSIQALGVEPDVVVESLELAEEQEDDSRQQRREDTLRGRLANEQLTDEQRSEMEAEEAKLAAEKLRREDYQLSYALDLLRGLSVYSSFAQ